MIETRRKSTSRTLQYYYALRIDVGSGLRLPAEGPLKRRDGSSCKSTLNPLPGLGLSTHGTTLFTVEPKVCAIPRGRKTEGLRRNWSEIVGTGPDSWRTNSMELGGGPQGNNLFPQAGRLSSSRKVSLRKYGNKVAKSFSPRLLGSAELW